MEFQDKKVMTLTKFRLKHTAASQTLSDDWKKRGILSKRQGTCCNTLTRVLKQKWDNIFPRIVTSFGSISDGNSKEEEGGDISRQPNHAAKMNPE